MSQTVLCYITQRVGTFYGKDLEVAKIFAQKFHARLSPFVYLFFKKEGCYVFVFPNPDFDKLNIFIHDI